MKNKLLIISILMMLIIMLGQSVSAYDGRKVVGTCSTCGKNIVWYYTYVNNTIHGVQEACMRMWFKRVRVRITHGARFGEPL